MCFEKFYTKIDWPLKFGVIQNERDILKVYTSFCIFLSIWARAAKHEWLFISDKNDKEIKLGINDVLRDVWGLDESLRRGK